MAKKPVINFGPGGCAAQDVVQTARAAAIESLKKARISPDLAQAVVTRIATVCFAGLHANGEQSVARAIREIAAAYIAANQGGRRSDIDGVIAAYGLDLPTTSECSTVAGRDAVPGGRIGDTTSGAHSRSRPSHGACRSPR